ncbi:multidrug efflux SMR transporter [Salinisphaera sp. Q1T1-3]|uniref:DMT family transporter n=1 Tax=Salinisphaera sp. Q1T1-3 TaxID=2321229 RepID=UPI000E76FDB8|nr:multidrug efflux SMR transporter [Salinisphaera sp. Q1T1-3]RJS95126.1 QacE family quaternary ammonium compound efflux SMR transporter [Salinisphaera sp. Q1T1-3]
MSPLVVAYVYLFIAIVAEIAGTTMLARSEQFTRWAPTLGMAIAYILSFYLLTLALRTIPLAIAYAFWGGLGIVLTVLVGVFFLRQPIDAVGVAGIALIVAGVIVINGWSRSVTH